MSVNLKKWVFFIKYLSKKFVLISFAIKFNKEVFLFSFIVVFL